MNYCNNHYLGSLQQLLNKYGLIISTVDKINEIPGSFWGDEEAGLIDNQLFVRPDTPIHSALHEACHYICMDEQRREGLHTNAGGGYDEENAVCYLQVILAEHIDDMTRDAMYQDMDEWGYSFRLGSTREWFLHDAQDARQWLEKHQIIDDAQRPTWKLRI